MTTPGNEGRFDGYDVLGQRDHWDAVTRAAVQARLTPPAGLRFFTSDEAAVAGPLMDLLLGQHDEPRIDVLSAVDARLADDSTDGWHHADLPPDGVAWRQSLQCLDEDAHDRFGRGFAELRTTEQLALIQAVQEESGSWHGWRAQHVWDLWMRYACAAFYAHPWAWNEIGYGGPAYPRGYKNLGGLEPWERPERDAHDPVPWARRTEQARRAFLDRLEPRP